MKQLTEIKSPLLARKEITFELEHFQKPTPKESEIKKSLAEKLKISEDLIQIKKISTHFGSNTSKITINVYESKEELQKNIKLGKKAKEALAKEEEAKKAAESTEAPKESPSETPKAEVKETPKEETKAEVKETPKEETKE